MKVILLKDVKKVGEKDQVVDVSEGYARNFLFPGKLAETAIPQALKDLEKRQRREDQKLESQKDDLKKLAQKLGKLILEVKADVGSGGKLFGSVTNMDICEVLRSDHGIEIDKKRIVIEEPIKSSGDHTATVRLYSDIEAKLNIKVVPSK